MISNLKVISKNKTREEFDKLIEFLKDNKWEFKPTNHKRCNICNSSFSNRKPIEFNGMLICNVCCKKHTKMDYLLKLEKIFKEPEKYTLDKVDLVNEDFEYPIFIVEGSYGEYKFKIKRSGSYLFKRTYNLKQKQDEKKENNDNQK